MRESSERSVRSEEMVKKKDSVVVAERDTIREVTTIQVLLRQAQDPTEPPDTVKVTQVTERDRIRDANRLKVESEKLKIVRDTVYVATRDSVFLSTANHSNPMNKASPVVSGLKWIFAIIVAIGALIIVIKVSKVFRFINR